MDLPKSVYYYHHKRIAQRAEDPALAEIKEIKEENPNYGYRSITDELRNRNWTVNHKRVYRLMKENHLQANAYNKKTRKYNSYKGTVGTIAPNLLKRRFETDRPYQKLTADITELRWGTKTTAERAYFQPIYDLYSGEVLSFNLGLHPTVDFAVKPLREALDKLPQLPYRTTVHTDQGFQYQNRKWVAELKGRRVFQSMSRKGNCLDNAAMESFFHILKTETVHSHHYTSYEEMAAAVVAWIAYYNHKRIKRKLGGKSPVQYRILTTEQAA